MQKNPSCPSCQHVFGTKDTSQGNYVPLLLQCGHTYCENCLSKLAKIARNQLPCPKCNHITPLEHEGSTKGLWPDLYLLGLLSANKKTLSDNALINLLKPSQLTWQHASVNRSTSIPKCDECSEACASCKCLKCDAVLCQECFTEVHSKSRTLLKHVSTPLSSNESKANSTSSSTITSVSIPNVCVQHENRPIEYYCDDDDEAICSHCVIIGSHKEHAISSLEEKNKKAIQKMNPAMLKAKEMARYLSHSNKVIQSALSDIHQERNDLAEVIQSHFTLLHAQLQAREIALLEKLNSVYREEAIPIEKMRTTVTDLLPVLDEALKEAVRQMSLPTPSNQAQSVLQSLQVANGKPVLASVSETDDIRSANISLDDTLMEKIQSYGHVAAIPCSRVKLSTVDEAPQEILMSALMTPESSVDLSGFTDSESLSQGSSTSSHPNAKQKNKSLRLKRQIINTGYDEMVYVTHIKNPHQFVVQRCSEYDHIKQLSRQLNKYCNNKDRKSPSVIEKDTIVLAQFSRDKNWYRARVQEINNEATPAQFLVYYVDYGNTEVVTIDRLRAATSRFLNLPEQALLCCLVDIAPSGKKKKVPTATLR